MSGISYAHTQSRRRQRRSLLTNSLTYTGRTPYGCRGDGRIRVVLPPGWVRETAEPFVPPGEMRPPEMTLEDIEMTLVERVSEWPKQWVREGLEQGRAEERALLRRMATSRFGAEIAERLAEELAGIADPERLAEVGEWLVRSDTGGEFLSRVTPAGTKADRGDSWTKPASPRRGLARSMTVPPCEGRDGASCARRRATQVGCTDVRPSLTRTSHHLSAADADLPASATLNAA